MKQKPFKVESLTHLESLANSKKAVFCHALGKNPMSAAFVMSMQGRVILSLIRAGLFLYVPKPKSRAPFARGGEA